MKTFKQFLKSVSKKKKDDVYQEIELVFGSHSKKKNKNYGYQEIELKYGSHSRKKDVKEELNINAKPSAQSSPQSSSKYPWPHTKTSTSSYYGQEKNFEDSSQGLHDKLVSHYSQTISDSEQNEHHYNAIQPYTSGSSGMNGYLLQHKGTPESDLDKIDFHERRIKRLDETLNAHKTPESFTVYTGVGSGHPLTQHLNNAMSGTQSSDPLKFVHHAFTSTSINEFKARGFAGGVMDRNDSSAIHAHVMKIDVPKDHPGAYVDHVSSYQGEREFILPRGTRLSVNPKPESTAIVGDTHYHTWRASIDRD